MRNLIWLFLMISLSCFSQNDSQERYGKIESNTLKATLNFLASDWTQGREAGTKGAFLAGDYIASLFRLYGLKPAYMVAKDFPVASYGAFPKRDLQGDFFQSFPVEEYQQEQKPKVSFQYRENGGKLTLSFTADADYSIPLIGESVNMELPVVFVGYGITDSKTGYDDYKNIDVKGKAVICLKGYPQWKSKNAAQVRYKHLSFYPKARTAQSNGAVLFIEYDPYSDRDVVVTPNQNIPFRFHHKGMEWGEKPSYYYDKQMKLLEGSIPSPFIKMRVNKRMGTVLLDNLSVPLETFMQQAGVKKKGMALSLKGSLLKVQTFVKKEVKTVRNIIGVLPGKQADSLIVIGAHYDHLGYYNRAVYNGADDNASGVAGMLALAKAFSQQKQRPEKTIVFCAWTAEERGLLGSRFFVDHIRKSKDVALYLNFDMIGRDNSRDTLKNQCMAGYSNSQAWIKEQIERHNDHSNISLDLKLYPVNEGGGSDFASFLTKGVPVFYFMAGMHEDYHQPSDEAERINYRKMTKIVNLGYQVIFDCCYPKAPQL